MGNNNNEKAEKYNQLLRENDILDHKISQLKATNAGINLSEETEGQILQLQQRKVAINDEIMRMFY